MAHCSAVCRLLCLSTCTTPVLLNFIIIRKGRLLHKFIRDRAIRAHIIQHRENLIIPASQGGAQGATALPLAWVTYIVDRIIV